MPVIYNESEAMYRERERDHITSHSLALFRKSPILYYMRYITRQLPQEDTPAMAFGRAAHVFILEGEDRFNARYAAGDGPVNPKTGRPYGPQSQAWQEWAEKQRACGKEIVSSEDFHTMWMMHRSVRKHGRTHAMIIADRTARHEVVLRGKYAGADCQARLDLLADTHIVELKTCEDIDDFEYTARRYGYVHQVAFYRCLYREIKGKDIDVYLVAVEKRKPHRVGVWAISPEAFEHARTQNEAAIAELLRCSENCIWPSGYENIRVIHTF